MELEKIRNLSDEELRQQAGQGRRAALPPPLPEEPGQQRGRQEAARRSSSTSPASRPIARERELAAATAATPVSREPPRRPRAPAPRARKRRRTNRWQTQPRRRSRRPTETPRASRRNEKVGLVVSTKMQKTIVVEIEMRKAHPKYKRVMKSNKKFYAHDEQNSARVGDVVRIREARPLVAS